jgi:hypothetical protein
LLFSNHHRLQLAYLYKHIHTTSHVHFPFFLFLFFFFLGRCGTFTAAAATTAASASNRRARCRRFFAGDVETTSVCLAAGAQFVTGGVSDGHQFVLTSCWQSELPNQKGGC